MRNIVYAACTQQGHINIDTPAPAIAVGGDPPTIDNDLSPALAHYLFRTPEAMTATCNTYDHVHTSHGTFRGADFTLETARKIFGVD